MSYTTYVYDLPLCIGCGMKPLWNGSEYMCDSLYCPSCGKSTRSYWDGADFALSEWCKMNGTVVTRREILHD